MADPSERTRVSHAEREGEETLRDAVQELTAQVRGLQAELQAARSRPRPLPTRGLDAPGWDEEPASADQVYWVRSLDSPGSRRPAVPRLLLEVVFLAVVAVLAAVAELDAPVVGAVMAGAWILVVLAEWLAAREVRLREAALLGAPSDPFGRADASPWLTPPTPRTELEVVEGGDESAAKLPPPSED